MSEKNKGRKCSCGHWEIDHVFYVNGGKNRHGSRYVCTKDNCYGWRDCDLGISEKQEIKGELGTYPKHNHPHGLDNIPPNNTRIWVCEECLHIFTDTEIKADLSKEWGHDCKQHPCRKGQRCESHLEPYIPELGGSNE